MTPAMTDYDDLLDHLDRGLDEITKSLRLYVNGAALVPDIVDNLKHTLATLRWELDPEGGTPRPT